MYYLFASDLHGSISASKKLVELDKQYHFKKIYLLGDIGYSGARNVPPSDYFPIDVFKNLNLLHEKTVFISGNCDSRVDSFVLKKKFYLKKKIKLVKHIAYLTHGDLYNKDNLSLKKNEILIYGHTHVYELEKINEVYFINPGSMSLPKVTNIKTYLIFDTKKEEFLLFDLNDNLIKKLNISEDNL